MQERKNKRKNWIDAAKAVAIFIVVLNHSGLIIPGVNFWGGIFFVPVFFVLAGYTYHVGTDSFQSFFKRKAKRILLPYLAANAFLFLFYFCLHLWKKTAGEILVKKFILTSLAGILYGRNGLFRNRISGALMINLNAPTWFLPALFLALVIMEALFRLFHEDEKKVLAVIVVYALIGVVYHYSSPLLLPWCIDIMPFFLLMMYAGFWLKKTGAIEDSAEVPLYKRIAVVLILLVVMIASRLINGPVNLSLSHTGKSITLMLSASISSSVLLMIVMHFLEKSCAALIKALAGVGRHTLTILCYHYFILSWSMEIGFTLIAWFGMGAGTAAFVKIYKYLCMIAAIAACIILDILLETYKSKKI